MNLPRRSVWFALLVLLMSAGAPLEAGVVYQNASGITFSEAGGLLSAQASGITFSEAGGIVFSEAGGITFSEAGGITFSEAGGLLFSNPTGITFSEAGGITFSEAGGIVFSEAGGIVFSEAGGITFSEAGSRPSIDLDLLAQLAVPADTSSLNVVVTYRSYPAEADFDALRAIGINGGTLLRVLPSVIVEATKDQVRALIDLPNVQSVYTNKNTPFFATDAARLVHADAAAVRPETTSATGAFTGRGVGVAILDTGIDATHPDLAGQVRRNIKVISSQGAVVGFVHPFTSENLDNTDLVYGHGTAVASVVAGLGKSRGFAQGAHLVGVSVGEATLVHVLEGLDTILTLRDSEDIRIVNCSFGVQGMFDPADPVNVATRMLYESGSSVVMAVGNHGPRAGSISPYAVAPWVIGVAGAAGERRLADFSSRGYFASALYAPAVSAPAVDLLVARTAVLTSTGSTDAEHTIVSGTSFATPIVSGLIASMIEANPALTPDQIRKIVQETATSSARYERSEAGAGFLNFAAALHAARDANVDYAVTLREKYFHGDYFYETPRYQGTAGELPAGSSDAEQTLEVVSGTENLRVTLTWGPLPAADDLDLELVDPAGAVVASSRTLNALGILGASESIDVRNPAAGTWRAIVRSKAPALQNCRYSVQAQTVAGSYKTISSETDDRRPLEMLVRTRAFGSRSLSGSESVDRLAFARAFVGAGQPKFLPAVPSFDDVTAKTALFAESAAGDAVLGSRLLDDGDEFRANKEVSRIELCRAAVRFAGLEEEALARTGAVLTVADAMSLTPEERGYVSVAFEYGLMDPVTSGGADYFHASGTTTAAMLAKALYNSR